MLLRGSILILFVGLIASQEYEEHSSYEEGSDHPDYSKYYNVDTSAPLIASVKTDSDSTGFATPLDFTSFFNTQHFDLGSASNKQAIKSDVNAVQDPQKSPTGFVNPNDFESGFADYKDPFTKDYFEQAQKTQQKETSDDEFESKPGPNYISYKVPPRTARNNYDSSEQYNRDVEREELDEERSAESNEKAPKKKINYEYNIEHKPFLNNYNAPNVDEEKIAALAAASAPFSPQYYAKYTQNPQQLTPYQKYSFQPVTDSYGLKTTFVNNIQSTAAPYNPSYSKLTGASSYVPQQTENIPKSLKLNSKACKKVNKQVSEKDIKTGRFKRQAMDCFVCEDPKTGANYEQCSYSSQPENENYFVGTAEKYSQPSSPYRFKRDTKKEKETSGEEYVNPYDYVKSQSHKYYSKPEEFESTYYNPKDYGAAEEYRFGPEFFSEGEKEAEQEPEESYSEKQAEALKKNPENCKKIKKSGMTCMICKNEKTGGNYEQCSYTSAPAEKKYAYVRERKFDKDDNPIEDKVVESSDPKELAEGTETEEKHVPKRRFRPTKPPQQKQDVTSNNGRVRSKYNTQSAKYKDNSYDVPTHFEKVTREKKPTRGLDPKLYGSADSAETKKTEKHEYPDLEEYHFKLFPQYNKEESKNEEKRVRVPDRYKSYEAEETQKDVEEVLAEFAKKDRSNCKKAHRHGMTCYLCVDKKGIENEECMYVSESQPKSSHVAYHEMQKVKSPAQSEKDGSASESKLTETEQPIKRKRIYKKVTTESPKAIGADSNRSIKIETTTTNAPQRITRRLRRTKNVPKDVEQTTVESKVKVVKRKAEPTVQTPEEFNVGSEEGAYSSDTKPIYSESFGATLPKYMIEKTEYEADFDKFSSPT